MSTVREKLIEKEKSTIGIRVSFIDKVKYVWKDKRYIFDIPTFIVVLVAAIYLTFISTNYATSEDPQLKELGNVSNIVSNLLVLGLVFYILLFISFKKEQIDPTFDVTVSTEELQVSIIFSAVFFGIEYVIQTSYDFLTLSSIDIDLYFFYVTIAIAETIIFACMFQITFETLFKSPLIGILAHAIGFMIYHMNVYGTSGQEMFAVFLSGLVFALTVKFAKRLSIAVFIHILINIIASGALS